jgi:hypothetical protein
MKRPVIYYHLWREGDWLNVNAQIFTKLVESGLAEYADSINICINDTKPIENIILHGIPEEKVTFKRIRDTRTEWPTLEILYDEQVNETDVPVLYLHSKGASYSPGDPRREAVHTWVDGLLYYLVEDWRTCFSMLRTGALSVGANKKDSPNPHFSGNFWWIMSDAIKGLPNPKMQLQTYDNRFGAEFWIGNIGTINLKNNGLVGFDYLKVIPRSIYVKDSKIKREDRNICIHVDTQFDLGSFKKEQLPHDIYRNGFNSYARTYLEYIIDNYENLPEYNYFLRTSQLVTHTSNIFDIVEKGTPAPFELLSRNILECNSKGEPHHPGLPIQRFWDAMYPEYSCPETFKFGAGAQFVASRDKILENSLDFYINVLQLVSTRINPLEDFILERLWLSIFGEKVAASILDFDLQVFIFNYGLMENAQKLYSQFEALGVNAVILDSDSGKDVPDLEYIHAFDNVYYSGLWNEALNLFTGSHMLIVTSDVEIPDARKLVNNAKMFYKSDKAWIYAPNVNYTFWDYETSALPDYSRDVKIVPNTDGMCWMLNSDAAFSVGNIDIEINKIGFGIDLLAAMFASREGKIVGRDYSITVKHPQTRSYDSGDAEKQEFQWIESLGYYREYIQYRNHFAMSFLKN